MLSQSHFLHCKNVRGVGSSRQAAVSGLILGEHSWRPLLAEAEGSRGDLTATFCLFKNMFFSGAFLKFLTGTFSKKHVVLFLSTHPSASSQTAEPLCSWEDFFQNEIFSLCLKVSILILKLQLVGETFKTF